MYIPESQIEKRIRLDKEGLEYAYEGLAASVDRDRAALPEQPAEDEFMDGAVRICLRKYGVKAGDVPQSCGPGEDRLEYLCGSVGVMWRDVRLLGDWYAKSFGVMLGKRQSGEWVALVPRKFRGYDLVDPATGNSQRVTKSVASTLEEDAFCLYRPLPQGPITVKDLVTFMFKTIGLGDYATVFVSAAAVAVVGMLLPLANKILFGEVIPSGIQELILPIAVLLVGMLVSQTCSSVCQTVVSARVGTKVNVATEAAVMARLFSLPTGFFKDYSAGNLSDRVNGVTMLCSELFELLMGGFLTSAVSLVYLIQIAAFTPSLVWVTMLVVIVDAMAIALSTVINARYDGVMMESNAKLSGTVTGLLSAIDKIKLAGAEDRAFVKWASGYTTYSRSAYNRPLWVRSIPAIVAVSGLLGTVAIFYLAAINGISVSDFMAFNVAYGQLVGAVTTLSQSTANMARIKPELELVRPILEATPEVNSNRLPMKMGSGTLEVSNVVFRYNKTAPYVLNHLSFKVRAGEYVGIVGHSGCGKSTILRLLLGFEQPELGVIYFDGQDISKVEARSLRRNLGTVMQDGKLSLGTLFSNITIANPSATLDDAWEAAEVAGIADDIRNMPMGMQTLVTEGNGGFSGGQRQRILIARAVCGRKRVLLFDEATSALDNVTQKHVSESLAELKCTRVVIAHRLSTVRQCDRILVIQDGVVAEEGSYDELIKKDGVFAELVRRQRLEDE